jgi:hypothetical protein
MVAQCLTHQHANNWDQEGDLCQPPEDEKETPNHFDEFQRALLTFFGVAAEGSMRGRPFRKSARLRKVTAILAASNSALSVYLSLRANADEREGLSQAID